MKIFTLLSIATSFYNAPKARYSMKRCLYVLLVLLCLFPLTSCRAEISDHDHTVTQNTVMETTTEFSALTDIESSSDTAGDSTILSPVRYTIDYEITDIFEKYPEIKTATPIIYHKNGQLYINALMYRNQTFQYKLSVLDDNGNLIAYDLPPFEENNIIPRFVYPLENGKYVLLYSPSREDKRNERHLTITDADGKFEKSVYISNYTVEKTIQVFEEQTNFGITERFIFIDKYDGYEYCYDMHLTETLLGHVYQIKKYLGDKRFSYGTSISNFFTVDLKTKETKEYALYLPTNLEMARIYCGSDKNYYYEDSNGIYQYQGNDQPIKILDRYDSGLRSDKEGVISIYILNSQAVFEYNAGTGRLLLYRMSHIPDTDTRNVIQIDVMGLTTEAQAWLADCVTQFNNQNDAYKIRLNMIGDIGGVILQDYYKETIEEMLLYGSHPDMLVVGDIGVLESYYEKNVFLDLNERISARLLGCVRSIGGDGTGQYQIPLNMHLVTLAATASTVPGQLTYDTFISIAEQLQDGQFLSAAFNITFFDIYSEFIDHDAKTSYFDSEEFRSAFRGLYEIQNDRTRYTDVYAGALSHGEQLYNSGMGNDLASYTRYGSENQYWTVNGTVGTALENGDLKFLSVEFNNIRAFPALKMLFGDTEFTLCGYPSRSGSSAYISSDLSAAVLWDTEYADGCAEFLNYLLSDSMQDALVSKDAGIPVTYSALSAAIDKYRYSFYDKNTADAVYNRNTPGFISLQPMEYSAEWLPAFDQLTADEQKRRICEITEDDKQILLRFFEDLRPRRKTVSMVQSIINEEISYWENNARSLEETTKIIDSRLWIYLNE